MSICRPIVILFVVIFVGGCSQSSWIQKDLKSIKQDIDTVSILFPQIEYIWKSTVETNNPNLSLDISKNFAEVVSEVIRSGESIGKPTKLLYFPKKVEQWSNSLSSEKKKKYIRLNSFFSTSPDDKTIFTFEPELNSLISKTDIKYLLVVNGIAFETDMSVKHEDIQQRERFKLFFDNPMDYQMQWNGLQVELAIINARTHEVVWYNYNKVEDSKYNPHKKSEIKSLCFKLLESE